MWRLIVLLFIAFAGFWVGMPTKKAISFGKIDPDTEFPLTEHKSFVIVVYAHNQSSWCKRTLRSIFEQDYDHYRIVMIDDASVDGTDEMAKNFIVDNNQDEKVIFIRNDTYLGPVASLYRVIDNCLDREIVIPMDAKDWFTTPNVLGKLNMAYQNPDVWMATGWAIEYPAYRIREEGGLNSYYAALFKEIRLQDLFSKGRFATHVKAYLGPIKNLAGGRVRNIQEPLGFLNLAPKTKPHEPIKPAVYHPLAAFPAAKGAKHAEVVILSEGHPSQLYACLESIQRYVAGFEKLTVLHRGNNSSAYKQVQDAFPAVIFTENWKGSPSEYVLLGTDDQIVKDFVDLKLCMDQMEKTGAAGFFLKLGQNIEGTRPPSGPLSFGTYVWEFEMGEGDWANPERQLALYKKETVQKALSKKTISLDLPENPIGLYFEESKSTVR
ncbi:MAG: glycosyltransferase [Parachlamydiales bacterium]|nr:glycosyltransferase [Parachlamydiales bacterium]